MAESIPPYSVQCIPCQAVSKWRRCTGHHASLSAMNTVSDMVPSTKRVANAWRNQRWDSFTLVTSNFQVRMPGAKYGGNDPYGFMSLAEVVEYFDNQNPLSHLVCP